jgi:MoaA/NifB/PqqE/SkfB family radical SAM enzyme
MNDVIKYFAYKISESSLQRWYPFLSVFYLTYSCDFRCFYCSNGDGKPYHELAANDSSLETAKAILHKIRRYSNHLILTGGEPFLYKNIPGVLAELSALKFKSTVLTTNAYKLDVYCEYLNHALSTLVVSLDSIDKETSNRIYGLHEDRFTRIIENIQLAKNLKKRNFDITVSSVASESTVKGLYDVYEYSMSNGFTYAAAPRLLGVTAESELHNNDTYRSFFNYLIKEKRKGRKIFGSVQYLEYMRDLRKFTCKPFTMLVVAPDGGIFYPCLEKGGIAGNILEDKNLHQFREEGLLKFGPQPICGNQCHSACALSFGLKI